MALKRGANILEALMPQFGSLEAIASIRDGMKER